MSRAHRLANADRWALTGWDTLSALTRDDLLQRGMTLLFTRGPA